MKKNNFWNRIFHKNEVIANQKQYELYKKQVSEKENFIEALDKTKELEVVMNIHKDAYGTGFTQNLGPGSMFRCEDVLTMTSDQVFLGGIYGLNTMNIPFWESEKDEPYGENGFGINEDYPIYSIILNQYKNFLVCNITWMYSKALKKIPEYEICGYRLN